MAGTYIKELACFFAMKEHTIPNPREKIKRKWHPMIGKQEISELLLILFGASPIIVTFYMFWLCWTRGRDPERQAISVQYEPPDSLSPGECGALLENGVALRNITATMTDLSVKGYLAIEPPDDSDSPGAHSDYIFHLTKPATEWNNLKPHERVVLKSIFVPTDTLQLLGEAMSRLQSAAAANSAPSARMLSARISQVRTMTQETRLAAGATDIPRASIEMPELQKQFSLHLATVRDAIFERLVAGGYYQHRPDQIRKAYAVKGIFIGLLMVVAGLILAKMTGVDNILLIVPGLLTGAIILGFGRILPARTSTGARTCGKVLGFQEFLGRVEQDHIARLEKTPELFEKFLPYAMALGIEHKWTQAFADIAVPPPQWYRGGPGGGFLPIVNDLNTMSNQPRRL